MQKVFLTIVLVLVLIGSIAQAKEKRTPEQKTIAKTNEMVAWLKLTKEQEKMIYSINLRAYQSIEKYDTKNHTKDEKKKQKDKVQKLREDEFKKILSASQFAEYLRLEKEEDIKKDAEKAAKKKGTTSSKSKK